MDETERKRGRVNNLKTASSLQDWCEVYSKSTKTALLSLLNVEVNKEDVASTAKALEEGEDLYFAVLFTGPVYGEFLIGLTKNTAVSMLGFPSQKSDVETYQENRQDILDSFKEVINIAAGAALKELKAEFPDLTITPPRAIEGRLTLSSPQMKRVRLQHPGGELSCYIYIDSMKLDIIETIEKGKNLIAKEKSKNEEERRLNRAKSEFLANMSHELRTPLNGMIGMLDIIKSTSLNSTQQEQFNVVYRSGEFLLALISDILEFSRIEAGKFDIVKKPFDLRLAIESVTESLAAVVYSRNLDLQLIISPQIRGFYESDETRIKQILINLIGNAVKFTPTGSIQVNASVDENDSVVIRVIDTGIGIPAMKLSSIFESFAQVDSSDNRKYGGAGLGLTISKSIVEALSGKIYARSEEAKGAEFVVSLPLKPMAGPSHAAAKIENKNPILVWSDSNHFAEGIQSNLDYLEQTTTICEGAFPGPGELPTDPLFIFDAASFFRLKEDVVATLKSANPVKILVFGLPSELAELDRMAVDLSLKISTVSLPVTSAKIHSHLQKKVTVATTPTAPLIDGNISVLVVEDNPTNQLVLKTMLKNLGFSVEMAENGKIALDLVASGKRYDLVFMDCQMPVMNGYESTLAIRQLPLQGTPHLPIIALTANAFRETKQACFESGMDEFVTKPIKFDDLKTIIQKTLDKFNSKGQG